MFKFSSSFLNDTIKDNIEQPAEVLLPKKSLDIPSFKFKEDDVKPVVSTPSVIDESDKALTTDTFRFKSESTPVNTVEATPTTVTAYDKYKQDPSSQNLSSTLNSLRSTVGYALAANNAKGDPLIESKARLIAAKAIKDYDPAYNVTLPTYVASQLQKLTRFTRESRQAIKIPERFVYEAKALSESESALADKLKREPTLSELADHTNLSINKIEEIRKKQSFNQASEGNFYNNTLADDEQAAATVSEEKGEGVDFRREALGYVYHDLDYKTKKVLEHSTGYGGAKILTPEEIAKKIKLSPSQVYRINQKLSVKYLEIENALNNVYGKNKEGI